MPVALLIIELPQTVLFLGSKASDAMFFMTIVVQGVYKFTRDLGFLNSAANKILALLGEPRSEAAMERKKEKLEWIAPASSFTSLLSPILVILCILAEETYKALAPLGSEAVHAHFSESGVLKAVRTNASDPEGVRVNVQDTVVMLLALFVIRIVICASASRALPIAYDSGVLCSPRALPDYIIILAAKYYRRRESARGGEKSAANHVGHPLDELNTMLSRFFDSEGVILDRAPLAVLAMFVVLASLAFTSLSADFSYNIIKDLEADD